VKKYHLNNYNRHFVKH